MSIDQTAEARGFGIETRRAPPKAGIFRFFGQSIAVVAQGSTASTYSTEPFQALSAFEVGEKLGFGSPAHLIALMFWPNGYASIGSIPVWFFPLVDDGAGVAATGTITPGAAPASDRAYRVKVNNIPSPWVQLLSTDTVAQIVTKLTAAIAAVPKMPIVPTDNATDVTWAAKWKGASGNGIAVEIEAEGTAADTVTWTLVHAANGSVNPDVDLAIAKFGNDWRSLVLNQMEFDDEDTFDKFQAWGEGRWASLVHQPAVVFTGNTQATPQAAIAVSSTRTTDRVNAYLSNPGSKDLPFVVAARELVKLAKMANNRPGHDYCLQVAEGLTPGPVANHWDFDKRDVAVKGGCSTVEIIDGEVKISNVVTFHRPTGEDPVSYQHVVDIVKLQNIIYNLDLIFNSIDYAGAELVPDDQPIRSETAKKPKNWKRAMMSMTDSLALHAIVADPKTIKAGIDVTIASAKRVNWIYPPLLSGNVNIQDGTVSYDYLGQQAAA